MFMILMPVFKKPKELNISLCDKLEKYEAIILAVSHNLFLKLDLKRLKKNENAVIFVVKAFLNREIVDLRL